MKRKAIEKAPLSVGVHFFRNYSIDEINAQLINLFNPQIVTWYIGIYGLKKQCVEFYKTNLFNPIIQKNKNSVFWLIDLTAWNAFINRGKSVFQSSAFHKEINAFPIQQIISLSSSTILQEICEISDCEMVNYFKKALNKKFIKKTSLSFRNKNFLIREIFPTKALLVEHFLDYDVSKAYSIFQYLEGCFIVKKIIDKYVNKKPKKIEIAFVLPNNELDYYEDKKHSFEKDIYFLIQHSFEEDFLQDLSIEVYFYSFIYGQNMLHRPYNSPGKVYKKPGELLIGDIICI